MRTPYVLALILVVFIGITSRLVHTDFILIDKYLGDALYATMLYLGYGLLWPKQSIVKRAMLAMVTVTAIEVFQLSGIPSNLAQQTHLVPKLLAIALGTHFSWLDLLAYMPGVGLPAIWQHKRQSQA